MRELNTIKLSIIKVIYRNRVLRIALAIFCTFAGFQDSLCAQSSNSALARLAANLQPGSWAELETHGMTKELIASNGSYRTILEYADKAVWDSDSETLFFVGGGHYAGMEFISYNAQTNTWEHLDDPYWFSGIEICHAYHAVAIDVKRRLLFFLLCNSRKVYQYHIETKQWSQLPENPNGSTSSAMALEYFPEMDGLVHVINGEVNFFDKKKSNWLNLAMDLTMGNYHNFAEYNPVHNSILFGGGNSSTDIYKLVADGGIQKMTSAPFVLALSRAVITSDPVSGEFLVLGGETDFYSYNIKTDYWKRQPSPTVPIFKHVANESNIFGCLAAPVSNYGIVMFVKLTKARSARVFLYKHAAANSQ
ncbi:MAG: hypothetical protein H6695_19780 [Deferribacteres bacterium]|nr:hypothetical protein [candidate division KSB1 bacterium]MCB9512426.1 hypothetical protein [Deferribacteres bacterium]